MASKIVTKATYKVARTIDPIYTGGEVSASATGNLLATSVDGDILLVEIETGRPLLKIDGDGESVTSLALAPTSSHLVVCSRSLSMRIFALSPSEDRIVANLVRTLKPHTSPVVSSTIDATGSLLVTGGADGVAKVWDIRGGYCSHTFHGHGGLVTAVELFESGASPSKKGSANNRKRKSKNGDDAVMTDAPAEPTILLATGGEDGKIKIWDLNTRKSVATLDSHVSVVRSIKHSSEADVLLSASRDKTLVMWDAQLWQPQRVVPTLEVIESAGFVAGGKFCFTGGEHGKVRIWRVDSGREVTEKQQAGLETDIITTVVRVSAEDALLAIHQDQTMTLHSYGLLEALSLTGTTALPVLRRISGNHDEIIDMACVGPTRSLLALATNTESVKLISVDSRDSDDSMPRFGSDVSLLEGHQDIIICMDVDWSGHWLATGAKDNIARLWRVNPEKSSYECFATFSGHAESLGAIALPRAPPLNSPAAVADPVNHPPAYLITGSQDKTIKKWDTAKLSPIANDGEPINVAKSSFTRVAHEKDINAIDVSPIAPLFASASQDRTIKVWSLEDGSTTGILRGHKRGVWSVRFSPAGTAPLNLSEGGSSSSLGLLVSGSGDRTVKVWSLSTYTCLLTFEGHSNSVLKVIWLSPPGLSDAMNESEQKRQDQRANQPVIASASTDTLVKLWDPYASPDSDHLLTTLDNHTDRVWSLASPHPAVSTPSQQGSSQGSGSISSIPYRLITGAADARLTFWTDTTTVTAQHAAAQVSRRVEQDQLLQNHINLRNYKESIILSLRLNHPGRLLGILSSVISLPDREKQSDSITGLSAVDDILADLSQQDLYLLLLRVRDWNTNARTSPVAQRVLNVLFRRYPADTWTEMARNRSLGHRRRDRRASSEQSDLSETETASTAQKGFGGRNGVGAKPAMAVRDLFRALEVYTERHYNRMSELVDESYLIEYTLREMDEVGGASIVDNHYSENMVSRRGKGKGDRHNGLGERDEGNANGDTTQMSGADQLLMRGHTNASADVKASVKRVVEARQRERDARHASADVAATTVPDVSDSIDIGDTNGDIDMVH